MGVEKWWEKSVEKRRKALILLTFLNVNKTLQKKWLDKRSDKKPSLCGKTWSNLRFPPHFVEKSNFHKILKNSIFLAPATQICHQELKSDGLSTNCPKIVNVFSTHKKRQKSQQNQRFEDVFHNIHRPYYLL